MVNISKLKSALNKLSDGTIVLLETTADKSFETALASLAYMTSNSDNGIIISASRPYVNLMKVFQKNKINTSRIFILDLISKSQAADVDANNVMYLDNVSSLTNISLAINDCIKKIPGKKFVFIDSITTMLIHNEPYVFARFIHSILTRMRIHGVDGILVSLEDKTNREIRAEIAQLCDKVIKI
jgi:hypothetical protein